jgi:DNA polymerase-3 subunit epsilon
MNPTAAQRAATMLQPMRQIVLDTETTGLHAELGHRIIEIGAVELVNRRLTGNHFHRYVNPERDIDAEAVKVHGIESDFLAGQPPFAAICDDLLAFVAGAEIIIHNADFDVGFLDAELARLGRGRFTQHVDRVVDSLGLARAMFPGKRNGLDALCQRFDIDNSHRTFHGALLDAELLAEVYLALTRGQESLIIDTALDAGRRSVDLRRLDAAALARLPVVEADGEELAAHRALLARIDKDSKGKLVWREA